MNIKQVFLVLLCFGTLTAFFRPTETPKPERPNILCIEVDDLTAKYLGCFGADFAQTPNVDRLAKEGVVFDNAVCQGVMCGPSRNSVITGLYPHNLGFYENGQLPSLPKGIWTFPKALQQKGYHTMWVGKNHVRPNQSSAKGKGATAKKNWAMQHEMGFDEVYQSAGRVVVLKQAKKTVKKDGEWQTGKDAYGDFLYENGLLSQFMKDSRGNKPTTLDPDTEYMDGHFTTVALEKMKNYKEEKPFFLWVNYSCPHGPFDAPRDYHDRFKAADMPTADLLEKDQFEVPAALRPHPMGKNAKAIAQYRAEFSATIAYMDAQVGRLVDYIKSSPYADNTVIVFFSDHGILTGEHGLEHKSTLYHEVLNPSLIVSFPKKYQPKRVETPVELLDLGKTFMDIAKATEAEQVASPQGNSLLPLLEGREGFTGNGLAFSEIEGFISVFDGRYKLIEYEGGSILFDHGQNPSETINYAEKMPQKTSELQAALRAFVQKTGEPMPPAKTGKKGKSNED